MESGVANYLHKKFKKQLSIEPKPQQHDKENKDLQPVEPREEKIQCFGDKLRDDSVPNQSTNLSSPPVLNASSSTNCKSSKSTENCIGNIQSSNSHISYLVFNNQNTDNGQYDQNIFDTTPFMFSTTESTNNSPVNITSSIFNTVVYTKREESTSEEVQDYSMKNEPPDVRIESREELVPPTPDKSSGGKYVCTYCNLVCSKPSVLQKHIRAHTNERPYPCISCGFSFKTRSNLYKHCRSRTHANRVMGNKAQEGNGEQDMCKSAEIQYDFSGNSDDQLSAQDLKNKPYKPRFHTAQCFTENPSREYVDEEKERLIQQHANSDILSHHINEIINKNNSIVNSNESSLYKRRMSEMMLDNNNDYTPRFNRAETLYIPTTSVEPRISNDEPLNLTNKNRKRSMSEVAEPVIQKSLIKELLLKNLSSDMQCKYCKMIFQTVTELELHKIRSCKGKPSDLKYTRSSSVNVASILTKNKNAFDNLPQLQNTLFPLNSPGPFLGKTRLVDGDKSKSFSFDGGNLPLVSPTSEPPATPYYLLSPISFEKEKKAPVKMFGGEVKVHTSGETKSYRIADGDDNYNKDQGFLEYGGKLSENRLVKSSLQSGGTVLTNKTNYSKQDSKTPQEVIRVYENSLVSPSIGISSIGNHRFNFDRSQNERLSNLEGSLQPISVDSLMASPKVASPSYKFPNMMDFSQKAVKLLTPNLKQPYLTVSGVSSANKFVFDHLPEMKLQSSPKPPVVVRRVEPPEIMRNSLTFKTEQEDRPFISKSRTLSQTEPEIPNRSVNNICNPMSLLVNGKVVRYVPGMPGPVIAPESPGEQPYASNIIAVPRQPPKELPRIPSVVIEESNPVEEFESLKLSKSFLQKAKRPMEKQFKPSKLSSLEIKTEVGRVESSEMKSSSKVNESVQSRSPNHLLTTVSETKKFARPNSLALKPTTASMKQHHGLTPTIFNQILISPDTPRVAKKYAQHFLHGNYFSYLGLKSSTKPVYCTLNKTQPSYVPHFKKLSMYSEWRQQDTKTDKLYVSAYDSRQKSQKYSTAGKPVADLIIHSSYKFIVSEVPSNKGDKNQDDQKPHPVLGGYECNDDYTYVRGRGRGRYVCDQCGIRCKKPSMLKKHIRTHSNDRPYTCSHCNFSFKTKGNLTKHMKSKAHTKNYAASSGSGSSTQLSGTQSSESDTDDSGMDSSDESTTRQQEHEAAYGLLSLSQKPTQSSPHSPSPNVLSKSPVGNSDVFMTTEEITHVSKTNYAKNKILDEGSSAFSKKIPEISPLSMACDDSTSDSQKISNYLGKSCVTRPLTYPYTSAIVTDSEKAPNIEVGEHKVSKSSQDSFTVQVDNKEPKSIKQFHVIQKYAPLPVSPKQETKNNKASVAEHKNSTYTLTKVPTLKVNDMVVQESTERKRKFSVIENNFKSKLQKNEEVMDLSMPTDKYLKINGIITENLEKLKKTNNELHARLLPTIPKHSQTYTSNEDNKCHNNIEESKNSKNKECNKVLTKNASPVLLLKPIQSEEQSYPEGREEQLTNNSERRNSGEYDNSAMETLADIATKQVKLEKNTLAKSVASEFLKLATKNEKFDIERESGSFVPISKEVNELMVKPEGNKSCTICSKSFSRPSQLRLHMNIHYLERPFRCDSCSVSFRTKGHLHKHERSASHHSKLSSSPAQASSEPRPFKCSDCNIAFRIHGHLAKHLRSKMHIMKLECLAKIPFGLYAELERSNSLLTEINTCDADQCLESLKNLAKKVLISDPNKLQSLVINQLDVRGMADADS